MHISRLIILLSISVVFFSCNRMTEETSAIRQDVFNILPEGKYDVGIYGEVAYNDPRLVELQKKMAEAVQKNADWFAEFKRNNSMPLPYHVNLGLTPFEYKEFLILSSKNKPMLKRTNLASLEVMHRTNEIRFRSVGPLDFFDDVVIRFRQNSITMNEHQLKYLSAESSADSNNIFRSPWKGYSWQYLSPKNALQIPKDEYQKRDVSIYQITIGKLEQGNRTFIIARGIEYKKGEIVFAFDAPIIF